MATNRHLRPSDAANLKAVVTVLSVACDGDTPSMIGLLAGAVAVIAGSSVAPDAILQAAIDSLEDARKVFARFKACKGAAGCSCHPPRTEPS